MKKKNKPKDKLILRHMSFKDYFFDSEMLDWYLDSGLNLENATIKNKFQYEKGEW